MAGQLLPLRLLTSSNTTILFSRLKTLTSTPKTSFLSHLLGNSSVRSFSSRVPRSRDNGRSGIRAGAGGDPGRSLIDDEADLSDWISELKTDSIKFNLRDSDEEGPDRDRKGSGMRSDRDSSDRRRPRGSVGLSERSSSSKRQFDGSDFEDRDRRSSRGLNGSKRSLGSSGGFPERKSRSKRFASDSEDEDEDEKEEILYRHKRGGHGSSSSFAKRGGHGSSSSFAKRGGHGPSSSSAKRGGVAESSYKQHGESFRHMSDEDDNDEDDDDDEDENDDALYGSDDDFFADKGDEKKAGTKDKFLKSASRLNTSHVESEKPVSRSSGGDKNSYLSDTR